MQFKSCGDKWLIIDRGVGKFFDSAVSAWAYVFLMRDIRDNVVAPKMWREPVKSLVPGVQEKRVVAMSISNENKKALA